MEFPKRATVVMLRKADGRFLQIDSSLIGSHRNVANPVHFMFENMGGSLLLTRTLAAPERSSLTQSTLYLLKTLTKACCISNERGPTSADEFLPFALKEHVPSDSPLSGWQMSWIKEACRVRMENNFKTRVTKDFPLMIHDLSCWHIEHLVAPALHFATSNSISWAAGVGK
eukprot:3369680-Amphidinium_carterae.1